MRNNTTEIRTKDKDRDSNIIMMTGIERIIKCRVKIILINKLSFLKSGERISSLIFITILTVIELNKYEGNIRGIDVCNNDNKCSRNYVSIADPATEICIITILTTNR